MLHERPPLDLCSYKVSAGQYDYKVHSQSSKVTNLDVKEWETLEWAGVDAEVKNLNLATRSWRLERAPMPQFR